MNNKQAAACSLTSIFTDNDPDAYTSGLEALWLDDFPEREATIIKDLKNAFQKLQLTILMGEPNNIKQNW